MNRFERIRQDHRTENAEDYVELIGSLNRELGEARVSTVAQRLGVSSATVSRTVTRLRREGLIEPGNYTALSLTQKGLEVAETASERHRLVLSFLLAIGVPQEHADPDAEGIEHHVSEATLAAMRSFLESAGS